MKWQDTVNAAFEFVGGLLLWLNVRQIRKDKALRGVDIRPVAFFFVWSLWNLYLYPWAGLWLSAVGGVSISLAHAAWLGLVVYYTYFNKRT